MQEGWSRYMPALRDGFGNYPELAPVALINLLLPGVQQFPLHPKAGPGRQNCASGHTSGKKFSLWR